MAHDDTAHVPDGMSLPQELQRREARLAAMQAAKATRASHAQALKSAGIERLTIHGLRRSFSLLGEAAGAPAGAIAQCMGHKPSATAEGYRPRSVDALRPFVEQIEAHILNLAGVTFDRAAEPGKLRVVAG